MYPRRENTEEILHPATFNIYQLKPPHKRPAIEKQGNLCVYIGAYSHSMAVGSFSIYKDTILHWIEDIRWRRKYFMQSEYALQRKSRPNNNHLLSLPDIKTCNVLVLPKGSPRPSPQAWSAFWLAGRVRLNPKDNRCVIGICHGDSAGPICHVHGWTRSKE